MLNKLITFAKKYNYEVRQASLKNGNRFVFFHKDHIKDLVVIVHGLGNNMTFGNQNFIQKFLENDLNVFCFDLDGHSHDRSRYLMRSSIANSLDPVIEYLDSKKQYNMHLVGYSLGAYIAARYVTLNPQIALSLHLVAPMGELKKSIKVVCKELLSGFNRQALNSLREWGFAELTPALGSFRRSKFPLNHKEDNIHDAVYLWLRDDERNGVFDMSVDISGTLVYGSLDGVCPAEQMNLWLDRFPSLTPFVVRGAGHLTIPMFDEVSNLIIEKIANEEQKLKRAI